MTRAPLSWTEVRVLCPRGWQELVADALAAPPCTAVAFDAAHAAPPAPGGCVWISSWLLAADDSERTRGDLRERLQTLVRASGARELEHLSLEFVPLAPEDYASSWRKSWKPFRVRRLCVVPRWLEPRLRPGDVGLLLEPGGAFGSGRHATTRACLRLLGERIRGGGRVLDAGSGSGILSVAACLLGARSAVGFDVDPHALPHAEDLAARNAVTDLCRFETADFALLAREPGPYDVVLANLYADVVAAHAPDLAGSLAPTSWFAFSGCPRDRIGMVVAEMERAGLDIREVRARGRWRTIVGRASRGRLPTRSAAPA